MSSSTGNKKKSSTGNKMKSSQQKNAKGSAVKHEANARASSSAAQRSTVRSASRGTQQSNQHRASNTKSGSNAAESAGKRNNARGKVSLIKTSTAQTAKTNARANSSKKKADSGKIKSVAARAIVYTFIALLVVYVGYEIYFWFFAKMETVMALYTTVSETVEAKGIAIRDETVITTTRSGVIVSAVENGAKVYKGETVANVFASEDDAAAYHRIMEIDKALAEFSSMQTAAEDSGADIKSIEQQLGERLVKFTVDSYSGELGKAAQLGDDLLYLLNKSQIATKKETDGFSKRIDELKNEKAALEQGMSAQPEPLTSPMSGYFISSIDGYENILNTSVLEGLTPETLDGVMSAYHEPDSSMVIGKIADDYKWDIVCEVSDKEAEKFEAGKSYKIYLPYSDTDSITAQLSTVTPGNDAKRVLLGFKCAYMVSDLSVFRSQPITIELCSFTGLQVSESSIVYEPRDVKHVDIIEVVTSSGDVTTVEDERIVNETVPGVYILWGNEVKFRRIDIMFSGDGKAICKDGQEESGWLKRYDKIVTKTKGLYDGKIVLGAS